MTNMDNMRKYLLIIIILVSFLPAYSNSIRVVTDNYPPYNYRIDSRVVGLSTEVVKAVLQTADIDYSKIEMKPWPRIYKIALYKKNVLIYSIAKTEKRVNKFKWVGKIAPFEVYVYSNKDVNVDSINDLKHFKIGAVKDDMRAHFLIDKGLKSNVEYVENDKKNVLKLISNRIDIMLNDKISMHYRLKKLGGAQSKVKKIMRIDRLSLGLYMACSNKTPDSIVNKCRMALKKLKSSGRYQQILDKYLK